MEKYWSTRLDVDGLLAAGGPFEPVVPAGVEGPSVVELVAVVEVLVVVCC